MVFNNIPRWMKVGIIVSLLYGLLTIISLIFSVYLKKNTPLPYIITFINPFSLFRFLKSFPLNNFLSIGFHIYLLMSGIIFYFFIGSFITWLIGKVKEGED